MLCARDIVCRGGYGRSGRVWEGGKGGKGKLPDQKSAGVYAEEGCEREGGASFRASKGIIIMGWRTRMAWGSHAGMQQG